MTSTSQTISRVIAEERERLDDTIAAVTSLAEINSGTSNLAGTEQVQSELSSHFGALGADCEISASAKSAKIDDKGESHPIEYGPILNVSVRPEAKRRLLVLGHADTVFGTDSSFQDVRKDGPLLRGPGVTDMKGGLILMSRAVDFIQRHELAPDLGIDLLVNSDEEVGSLGSSPAFDAAAAKATSGMALVLEPRLPDGTHAGSRPASANIDLVIRGRSAHAGRALADGRNAVTSGSELAVAISALTGSRPRLG